MPRGMTIGKDGSIGIFKVGWKDGFVGAQTDRFDRHSISLAGSRFTSRSRYGSVACSLFRVRFIRTTTAAVVIVVSAARSSILLLLVVLPAGSFLASEMRLF